MLIIQDIFPPHHEVLLHFLQTFLLDHEVTEFLLDLVDLLIKIRIDLSLVMTDWTTEQEDPMVRKNVHPPLSVVHLEMIEKNHLSDLEKDDLDLKRLRKINQVVVVVERIVIMNLSNRMVLKTKKCIELALPLPLEGGGEWTNSFPTRALKWRKKLLLHP